MKINEMLLIIVFCLALLFVASVVIPFLNVEPKASPVALAVSHMNDMSRNLSIYYENNSKSEKALHTSDIIEILKNNDSRIWSKKPVVNYNNKYDYGVFFLLPEELKSKLPTIIAYTTPLKSKKDSYRVALILNKTDMTAVFVNNYLFEKALDINDLNLSLTPDFYRCMAVREE